GPVALTRDPALNIRRRALDGSHDARVGAAAAEILGERRFDLAGARPGVLAEKSGRLHDHAVDAIAALHRLLVDEGLLQPMRLLDAAETFERDDFSVADGGYRQLARAHRLAVDDDRAGAALPEAAAEARPM